MTFAELRVACPEVYSSLVKADGGDVEEAERTWQCVSAAAQAEGIAQERERCEKIVALGKLAGVKVDLIIHAVESEVTPAEARDLFACKARHREWGIDSMFARLMVGEIPTQ